MKRLNPKTEKPFRHGEIREDGYVFYKYTSILRLDGTFKEIWLRPEAMQKAKEGVKKRQESNYVRRSNRLPRGTAEKLRRKLWVDHCRELYRSMLKTPYTQAELREFCTVPQIVEILLPFTSDYNGN